MIFLKLISLYKVSHIQVPTDKDVLRNLIVINSSAAQNSVQINEDHKFEEF